jgi:deoxyribonuclease-4
MSSISFEFDDHDGRHDGGHDGACDCERMLKELENFSITCGGGSGVVIFDDHVITGSHVPFTNSRISNSIEWGLKLGMYAIQLYMGGQQCYARSKITEDDIKATNALMLRYPLHLFTHSPVIYNLAGSVKNKSLAWCGNAQVDDMMVNLIKSLNFELSILNKVGGLGTVIHPGCYIKEKGKTQEQVEEEAIQAIGKTLSRVEFTGPAKVLLEICAGENGKVAYNLDQLVRMREYVCEKNRGNIAYCLDTAHAFGSGLYDLSQLEGVQKMFDDIDRVKRENKGCVELIHLNDSRVPLGSKTDRHELLRRGFIWGNDDTPLKYLLAQAGERRIPCILETSPSDMNTLHELLGEFV